MTRRGRKPTGAQLVERLAGSAHAKGRLRVILETLSGHQTIPTACAELGIQESMFHKLRAQVLQTAVDRLEPRPAGRPPPLTSAEARQVEELEAELAQARMDLKAAEIRRELAETLPRLGRRRGGGAARERSPFSFAEKGTVPFGAAEPDDVPVPLAEAPVSAPPPAERPGEKTTHRCLATHRRRKKRRRQKP
jgi:hypothetical protein